MRVQFTITAPVADDRLQPEGRMVDLMVLALADREPILKGILARLESHAE